MSVLREEVRGSPAIGDSGNGVGAAELARGLTYLRASNLQVMRLQLAAEQHDRRGIMAAIDELVGIDRELGRFIDSIPDPATDAMGREIDARKREVMAERLMLARGKAGPALAPEAEPAPAPAAAELELVLDQPFIEVWEEDEPASRARFWPWLFGALFVLCAALAAFLAFGPKIEMLTVLWESLS